MAHLIRIKRTSVIMPNIDASVGHKGSNRHDDVALVQWLLNLCKITVVIGQDSPRQGSYSFPLSVDGIFGPQTGCALTILLHSFRNWYGVSAANKIDPLVVLTGHQAMAYLNEYAALANPTLYRGLVEKKLPAGYWGMMPSALVSGIGKPIRDI
ncbi:MAG: hypothetical protein V9H25_18175 [Candidatus Competibacter sp.]|jgi:hypothetical protein